MSPRACLAGRSKSANKFNPPRTDDQMDWTSGYVTEVEYPHGYYKELCPGILRLACLKAGIAPPTAKPLRYLELGYGQGLSINIHAAAVEGEFWGTDFNPTQVARARALADASGCTVTLLDESFDELAARRELPEFDIIALHGIWSWISEENSRIVVDIIRRKLRAGGIVYISYNCLPGLASSLPLRHLLKLHADIDAESTNIIAKLDGALAFAQRVVDSGAIYFRGNPALVERMKLMSKQNHRYLAHEYLNQDWRVMAFADVVNWLDGAKLTFVASADFMAGVQNLPPEGQRLLSEIKHPILRESVRDYFVNQQFREDVFVKGPIRLRPLEQYEAFCTEAFVLTSHPNEVEMKIKGNFGEATLQEQIYRPLIEVLADNAYAPKKIEQLKTDEKLRSLSPEQLMEALLLLVGMGHAHPATPSQNGPRAYCQRLNQHLLRRARSSADISFLASPVTGGGVLVTQFEQLFLLGMQEGKGSAAELAAFAWRFSQGQGIVKDGKVLNSAEENIAELEKIAQSFMSKRLVNLKVLSVV
jgi:SAM-dependent methyltransferase